MVICIYCQNVVIKMMVVLEISFIFVHFIEGFM